MSFSETRAKSYGICGVSAAWSGGASSGSGFSFSNSARGCSPLSVASVGGTLEASSCGAGFVAAVALLGLFVSGERKKATITARSKVKTAITM